MTAIERQFEIFVRDGLQGPQGQRGLKGDPGPASTVAGPQGLRGLKGDKGDGPTAEDIAAVIMARPAWVERLRGPKGETGDPYPGGHRR